MNKKDGVVEISVSESEDLKYIAISLDEGVVLSWEEIQEIKDHFYPKIGFVEVYPPIDQVINKANVRHLFSHSKGFVPDLSIIEQDMNTKIISFKHE